MNYIKVYFILVHKNPTQLLELVSLLDDNNSLFFIHVDAKVKQTCFENQINNQNCHFIKNRVKCFWGTFSLVQATLNGMEEIRGFMSQYHPNLQYHFIMLSAECLPLKPNKEIHRFLESNRDISYLRHWKLPYSKWWGGGLFRVENVYKFSFKEFPKRNYWCNWILKKLNLKFLLPSYQLKKYFPNHNFYGNSQWMILSNELLNFVLVKSTDFPIYKKIFRYTLAPDEMYFASLILNFDDAKLYHISDIATHLVVFKGNESSPQYLNQEDIFPVDNHILFARKFDPQINNESIFYVKQKLL